MDFDFSDEQKMFREEVRKTYLHELGHYLGLDEDDLVDDAPEVEREAGRRADDPTATDDADLHDVALPCVFVAGDVLLQQVAAALRDVLRDGAVSPR